MNNDILSKIKNFLRNLNYDDLFTRTIYNKLEFNKAFFIDKLNMGLSQGYSPELVTEKMIDVIWEKHYSKYIESNITNNFSKNFKEYENSKHFNIIKHLHSVIGIKDIDFYGENISTIDLKYKDYLYNTAKLISMLNEKELIDNLLIDAHFKSLIETKQTKLIKTINNVNANKIKRNKELVHQSTNHEMALLYRESFFIIFEFYLTKIKIMRIYQNIHPLLNALYDFKHNRTIYDRPLENDLLDKHYNFTNTFPKKDADLYLILIFSIYLKSSYKNTREFTGLLLNKKLTGNFANRENKILENKYNQLSELESMIEYIDDYNY